MVLVLNYFQNKSTFTWTKNLVVVQILKYYAQSSDDTAVWQEISLADTEDII